MSTEVGSVATRLWVASRLIYQRESQRNDLLGTQATQTQLIASLEHLLKCAYNLEITAVRSDHHDDSSLSVPTEFYGVHAHGWAVDLWPLNSPRAGDYMDAGTHDFRQFLRDVASAPFIMQIGLAGEADTANNRVAAGPIAFSDDGGSHVHIGTRS